MGERERGYKGLGSALTTSRVHDGKPRAHSVTCQVLLALEGDLPGVWGTCPGSRPREALGSPSDEDNFPASERLAGVSETSGSLGNATCSPALSAGPPHSPEEHVAGLAGGHPGEGVHLKLVAVEVGMVWPYVRSTKRGTKELPGDRVTKRQPSHPKPKCVNIPLGQGLIQAHRL